MYKLIFQNCKFKSSDIEYLCSFLNTTHIQKGGLTQFNLPDKLSQTDLQDLRKRFACDVNQLPNHINIESIKLVVSDMDSTLINIECIDEIADFAGVKSKVSEITEAAMQGQLNFEESLIQRVRLLNGLKVDVLSTVYEDRLNLNPGAEKLIESLQKQGIKFALVSGGFTYFTKLLQKRLGIDFTLANELEVVNSKLNGNIVGDIVGAEAKASFIDVTCKKLNIEPVNVVAIGDGANDLKMMSLAGLGVAYHAKPTVQEKADCAINYGGLDGVLGLLGAS